MGHCSDPFWGSPLLSDNFWALWNSWRGPPGSFALHAPISQTAWNSTNPPCLLTSSQLGTCCSFCLESHASFICLVNFYMSSGSKSGYHLFCQPSLIWAHLSDGIYAQWDHCLLILLSSTLNYGLIEVRNHAWFTSLLELGKGPGISRHSKTSWTHSFNKCLLSIYFMSSVLEVGDTMGHKIDQTPAFSEFVFYSVEWQDKGMYECMNEWINAKRNKWMKDISVRSCFITLN